MLLIIFSKIVLSNILQKKSKSLLNRGYGKANIETTPKEIKCTKKVNFENIKHIFSNSNVCNFLNNFTYDRKSNTPTRQSIDYLNAKNEYKMIKNSQRKSQIELG